MRIVDSGHPASRSCHCNRYVFVQRSQYLLPMKPFISFLMMVETHINNIHVILPNLFPTPRWRSLSSGFQISVFFPVITGVTHIGRPDRSIIVPSHSGPSFVAPVSVALYPTPNPHLGSRIYLRRFRQLEIVILEEALSKCPNPTEGEREELISRIMNEDPAYRHPPSDEQVKRWFARRRSKMR